jgi:hypothetical protein
MKCCDRRLGDIRNTVPYPDCHATSKGGALTVPPSCKVLSLPVNFAIGGPEPLPALCSVAAAARRFRRRISGDTLRRLVLLLAWLTL